MDVLCTSIGIKLKLVSEANPILAFFINKSLLLTMMAVLLFVGGLLYFIYKVRNRIKWLPTALSLVVVVKVYVMFLHARWMVAALN